MKNILLLVLIIINTFLAIFSLVRTYKDKFSETNGKSMNILFDINSSGKPPKPGLGASVVFQNILSADEQLQSNRNCYLMYC